MATESWLFFMAIWIAASLPLGPNALNCIQTSAAFGFRRSLWSVVGIFAAANIHMTIALSGIAAFMTAHPSLFEVLRWLGVAYLAWMGVSLLRSSGKTDFTHAGSGSSRRQLVCRAMVISLSNPKAIFAWLAVFSQFIDAHASLAVQLVILAPSALSVTVAVYVGYCAVGLGVKRLLSGRRKRWFDRVAGSTYLTFAIGLATSDLRKA